MFLQNGGGCCARTGWVGQAHTDLFVPSTILSLVYHYSPSKAQSLELPPNADSRAPRSPWGWRREQSKGDKIMMLFSETETAKQNQKIPFHFFFRFAVEGWGEETRGKCKEIFWSLHTRVRERVRGAFSLNQDSARNTFELCPIHTAVKTTKYAKEAVCPLRSSASCEIQKRYDFWTSI